MQRGEGCGVSRGWCGVSKALALFVVLCAAWLASSVALVGLGPIPSLLLTASASCDYTGAYYHADFQSSYPDGADGDQATFQEQSLDPYVCDPAEEHSLESTGEFLKGGGNTDFMEIGELLGYATNASGSQVYEKTGGLWFFNYTSALSAGYSVLAIPQTSPFTGLDHTNSVQEVDVSGTLYAKYVTDSTQWKEQALPSGDNPGYTTYTNGEVLGDPADQMGQNLFVDLEYHAGTWQWWTNKTRIAPNGPYCNYDDSGSATNGQGYVFDNLGPAPDC